MKRRVFLTTSLGTLAGLAWTSARAESEFEAYRRSQLAAQQRFRDGRSAEFDVYQRDFAAAFDTYRSSYADAVKARQQELAAYWRNAELSSQTRWVEYSDNKAIQRIVDFDANQITLRLRPEAGTPNQALIRRELHTLLSTDLASTFNNDPVSQSVEEAVAKAAPGLAEQTPVKHALVLGELFDSARPSPAQVEQVAQQLATGAVHSTSAAEGVVTITVALPAERPARKAQDFLAEVNASARKWQVEPALVLAVIHTESAFNPLARSPVPAYGLMQIVPGSAGKDATELVYGKARVVTPSYLYDAGKNIQLGAAYLHILQTRYLRAITHPESRLYCMIAAYNTGAGNVARSYTGTTNITKAATLINQRSPQANYEHLRIKLPYQETRDYLKRVVARLPGYREL